MTMFICDRCGYDTPKLFCLQKHFQRKTPCKPTHSDISICDLKKKLELETKKKKQTQNNTYQCNFCDNVYKQSSHRNRHQKTCKDNPNKNQPVQDSKYDILLNEIRELKEQIQKNPTTNITNNNVSIDNSIRIKYVKNAIYTNIDKSPIVTVEDGKLSYSDFMIDCLTRKENGIVDIIKKVYFNEDYPENCVMSIDSQDLQKNTMKIYDGKDWFQEMWSNVITPFMGIWYKILYRCYELHSDDIQQKFMLDSSEEAFREAISKRLAVEDFLAYIEKNDTIKEHIRQCIAEHLPVVQKIHGYAPYVTIN